MKKQFFGLFLVLVLMLSAFSVSASESKDVNVLVIGDSISTGYGLSSVSTESFASLLVKDGGYTVNNKAVNGNTAKGILTQFSSKDISESDIFSADIITITCGGNDLMALLYSKTVEIWNERSPEDTITVEELPLEIMNGESPKRMGLMSIALSLLNSESDLYFIDDPEFVGAVSQYIDNLTDIVEYIHSKNSKATVIVATQYNPYAEFENATIGGFVKLSPLYNGMEAGTAVLNQAIIANSTDGGYLVADVKTAFDGYEGEGDLYNACPVTETFNIDFHPSAAGHRVIADSFMAVIAEIPVDAPENSSEASSDISSNSPTQTGDNRDLWLWLGLAVGLVAIIAIVVVVNRKIHS